jgi:hypothetical protein
MRAIGCSYAAPEGVDPPVVRVGVCDAGMRMRLANRGFDYRIHEYSN